MTIRAVHVPSEEVSLLRLQGVQSLVGNPQLRHVWTEDVAGAYVPEMMGALLDGAEKGLIAKGLADDNRSVIFPESTFTIGDKEYFLCVKGCGAQFDAFAHRPLTASTLKGICHDLPLGQALAGMSDGPTRFITGERWYGCSPYGAQAPDNAMLALLASMRADGDSIAGFYICPVVAAVRLPRAIEVLASRFHWYRRYDGTFWQELRLMPSNLRVYFQSPVTFGANTEVAFSMFGLRSKGDCDRFLEKLCRSSLAALTLYARTIRKDPRGGYLGLDLHDVWLDKDAVVARDGTLHFADLEGVEDAHTATAEDARERMRGQCYHHIYEASFALEAAATEAERTLALGWGREERKAWIMEAMERSSRLDGYARAERRNDAMNLIVEPAVEDEGLELELELFSEVGR